VKPPASWLKMGKPIAIGRLERFLADHEMYKPQQIETEKKNHIPVACVGTGPASLAAAADLAKKGYEVHLFEALHYQVAYLVMAYQNSDYQRK